ncbi:MAG TPA: hypothetical protein DEG17_15095 [Cyanobacteria bacterium UBA11149]|nr:hypothetical protein [Cyanobacteria bacterium UBA11367]HBE60116.1 hypothetical protein [Cyanobacteria bacterium UBA11366]HBK62692.1 hypothetical protein [Cyanobacteria bacterium UBA11166]HBR72548.1 hypothetical protein [Cyanobacteria bacterium UBA11159]HBS71645.1 hypothetical protein [Cyanobacteria bacterium UBA11153]HBW90159.1 hypothetical protein [Cyanobacteria bacterium UBA11149]HCA97730.1 hypothetical protein [Cyanobacteria bacterium UBA9226]
MIDLSGNLFFCSARIQYENLGDIIINKILFSNLRNYGILMVDDRGIPDWVIEELDLKVDERLSKIKYPFGLYLLILFFGLIALVKFNFKVYLIAMPGHHYGRIKNSINSLKSLSFFFIFRTIGIRICWFGASIGPFLEMRQTVEKWKSNFMYFYSVRDSISENYARMIGINRVTHFPDLAWLMETPNLSNVPVGSDDDYVIFSFRKASHALAESVEYKNNLCTVLDEIVKLVCGEWSKKLVISYQVEHDYEFCKWISDRYKKYCDVVFIEEKVNSQSMYNLYSRASLVFSNRLHVLLFAIACGSLPIAVVDAAHHDKISGIFADAGLMQLLIDIGKEPCRVEVLREIFANNPLIKEKITLYREERRNYGKELFMRVITETYDRKDSLSGVVKSSN